MKSVTLKDGTTVNVDFVIMGTGIKPNTEFLDRNQITLDERGGIVCDPFLNTSNQDVFAAGDVASFPYWQTGEQVRIEHWVNALDQGSYAAFNMLGKLAPFANIPFFWTRHYNKSIQYAGYATSF